MYEFFGEKCDDFKKNYSEGLVYLKIILFRLIKDSKVMSWRDQLSDTDIF